MITLSISEAPIEESDNDYPSYSDVGHILVKVGPYLDPQDQWGSKHEYEVLDHSGCVFWIREGTGIDWWLDQYINFPKEGGTFVVPNIVGTYIKGDWGYTDDDEEWDFDDFRPATAEEISSVVAEDSEATC